LARSLVPVRTLLLSGMDRSIASTPPGVGSIVTEELGATEPRAANRRSIDCCITPVAVRGRVNPPSAPNR
uniref:Kinesin motor domain-containing protein n=1 Tax=Rodentolepis nana TaxID=102285 RepID=A0A0R3TF05_RODNA